MLQVQLTVVVCRIVAMFLARTEKNIYGYFKKVNKHQLRRVRSKNQHEVKHSSLDGVLSLSQAWEKGLNAACSNTLL